MRVSRWLLGLILLLAIIVPAQAQQAPPATTKTLTAAGASNCTASAAGCLLVGAAGFGGLGVDLSGTFVGTVSFEGIVSTDTTGTFTAVYCTPWNSATPVASTTAVGQWGCPVGGLSYFRVRLSAYTSGSVVVVTRGAPTLARASGGGGGTITGSLAPEQVAFGTAVNTIGGSANLTWIGGNELIVADAGEVSLASNGIVFSGIADENTLANFYYYNAVYDGYAGFKMTDTGNTVWDLGNVSALLTINGRLNVSTPIVGDTAGVEMFNTSDTADSEIAAEFWTTGDNATGIAHFVLGVHAGGANAAEFYIDVAGDSGDAFPTTTATAPGALSLVLGAGGGFNDLVVQNAAGNSTDVGFVALSTEAGAYFQAGTDGDLNVGDAVFRWRVHENGSDEADFIISLAGDSGNNTPTTTMTFPGIAAFAGASAYTFNSGITFASASLPATTTTFTNGAAASVGTLTNAPAAGNPTKWIPINDNGTTRYIPAW